MPQTLELHLTVLCKLLSDQPKVWDSVVGSSIPGLLFLNLMYDFEKDTFSLSSRGSTEKRLREMGVISIKIQVPQFIFHNDFYNILTKYHLHNRQIFDFHNVDTYKWFCRKILWFYWKKKVNITYHSIYHHKALSIEGAKV